MALKHDPPEWLIQEYMNRKHPVQQVAEGAQGLLGTYAQVQQMQRADELKMADAKMKERELGLKEGAVAVDAAKIGYDPTNPAAYFEEFRAKRKGDAALNQSEIAKNNAMAKKYSAESVAAPGMPARPQRPPTGYRWTPTGELEPVPGGPAAIKLDAQAQKDQNLLNASISNADLVINKVDQALNNVSGWTTGLGGAVMGAVPGSSARNLRGDINTIKANLGFSTLQEMRRNSPTGGALGQIAIQELDMLQSTIASLDQTQDEAQLRRNFGEVKKHYEGWKKAVQGGGGGPDDAPTVEDGYIYTPGPGGKANQANWRPQ